MRTIYLFFLIFTSSNLIACKAETAKSPEMLQVENSNDTSNTKNMKLKITIGNNTFFATFYDNATTTAFKAKLPVTINMSELNGNEKFFDLPNKLPAKASKPVTVQTGDLMLYGSNTLVLFYKTFSTSYSYTRLGRIDNPSGLAVALGSENVTITFEVE